MNRVSLVGRITRDPELRTSASGISFVSFAIAVNRAMPGPNGERVADFINCIAFNKQAENLARFIKKGGLIGVEGKLQTRRYQATDGTNRTATEVVCDSVFFLESRQTQSQNGYNDYSSYEPQTYNPQPQQPSYQEPVQSETGRDNDVKSKYEISDDDLPF